MGSQEAVEHARKLDVLRRGMVWAVLDWHSELLVEGGSVRAVVQDHLVPDHVEPGVQGDRAGLAQDPRPKRGEVGADGDLDGVGEELFPLVGGTIERGERHGVPGQGATGADLNRGSGAGQGGGPSAGFGTLKRRGGQGTDVQGPTVTLPCQGGRHRQGRKDRHGDPP